MSDGLRVVSAAPLGSHAHSEPPVDERSTLSKVALPILKTLSIFLSVATLSYASMLLTAQVIVITPLFTALILSSIVSIAITILLMSVSVQQKAPPVKKEAPPIQEEIAPCAAQISVLNSDDMMQGILQFASANPLALHNLVLTSKATKRTTELLQVQKSYIEGANLRRMPRPQVLELIRTFAATFPSHPITKLNLVRPANDLFTPAEMQEIMQLCPQATRIKSNYLTDDLIRDLIRLCPRITTVDCSRSPVSDAGITHLAQFCPLLNKLNITGCHVTNASCEALAEFCKSLLTFTCTESNITADGMIHLIRECHLLTDIEGDFDPTDALLKELAEHTPALESLICFFYDRNIPIEDASVIALAKGCVHLRKLQLPTHTLTDDALSALGEFCPELRELLFVVRYGSSAMISDKGICDLARGCRWLGKLVLPPCRGKVSDQTLFTLAEHCKYLRIFKIPNLSYSDPLLLFTSVGLQVLAKNCVRLEKLVIGCREDQLVESFGSSDDQFILQLAKSCKNLRILDCTRLNPSNESISVLAQECVNLEELDLGAWSKLGDQAVFALATHCRFLRRLWTHLTDEGAMALAKGCPNLEIIGTLHSKTLTDEGVIALAQNCSGLTDVNFRDCAHLTDRSAFALAQGCKSLAVLDCSSTQISDRGVAELVQGCPQLRLLFLGNCQNITNESLVAIGRGCKKLESLACERTNISDIGVISLVENCRSLNRLQVNNTPVTRESLIAFGRVHERGSFICQNCPNLGVDVVEDLKQHFPDMRILG